MLELHRRLNRADVSKDAKNTRVVVTNDVLFNTCADNLFGRPTQSHVLEIKTVKTTIDGICRMSHGKIFPKARLPILHHPLDSYTHVLPDKVTYAIQDSGLAPEEFKHDLKFVITPASYLDSAGRSGFADDTYFGFNTVLTQKELQALGIHHIQTIKATLRESNICDAHLKFTFDKELRVHFNDAFRAVRGNKEFFAGNPTKNDWFNTTRTLSRNAIETGQMLILCKEIGDTLQAYYGKKFEQSLGHVAGNNKVCLFTSDTVLALRCRLLELPVVVFDAEKKEFKQYECFYYPTAGIVDKDIQTIFHTYIRNHNACVSNVIDHVLHQGAFLLDNRQVVLTAQLRRLFSNLKESINTITAHSLRMDSSYLTIQQYKEQITPFIVDHLFDSTSNILPITKLCPASAQTFPGGDFKTYIRSAVTNHRGGGDGEPEPPIANSNSSHRLAIQLRHEIYEIVKALSVGESEYVWRMKTEVLFNDFFRLFFYLGEVTLDRSFLQDYIQSVPISLADAKKMYVAWKKQTFNEDYEDDEHLYPVPPSYDDSKPFVETPQTASVVQVASGRRRRKTQKYRPRIKILPDDRFEPLSVRKYTHDTRRGGRSQTPSQNNQGR